MASCAYCNTGLLIGGVTDGPNRYCNENCHAAGYFVGLANQIAPETLQEMAVATKTGPCPKCDRTGSPVDVYKAHRIWSALLFSSWSSHPEVSCKSCAVKRQLGAILFCGTLGWWGFPWGVIGTPVQIVRNLVAMGKGSKAGQPSPLLLNHVKLTVGQRLAVDLQATETAVASPPPLS